MTGERHEPARTELDDARAEWEHRYRHRPETQAQRHALDLMSSGRVRRDDPVGVIGIDGAWYGSASLRPGNSPVAEPAVVVTTRAAAVAVVTGFPGGPARDAWLADRTHSRPVPLASASGDRPCRAAREELALAWLLRNAGSDTQLPEWLEAQAFTTYSRSEIFLAWCDAWPGATAADVADVLDRRLLRAPDWAAGDIGAPGERTVPAYLRRIAATPVTREQAVAAFDDLAREDAALAPSRITATAAVPPVRPDRRPSRSSRDRARLPARARPRARDPAPTRRRERR